MDNGIGSVGCDVDSFWRRFDEARVKVGKNNLRTLCGKTGVSYQTLVNQKCSGRYMTVPDMISMSKEIGCSIDWLLTGRTMKDLEVRDKLIDYIKKSDMNEITALAVLLSKISKEPS